MLAAVRSRNRIAWLALATVALLAATGCGGSGTKTGTVSANTYAGQVCTSLAGWLRDIQTRASGLESELGTHPSPSNGKSVLERFMGVAVADTENATSSLRGAGVPNVKNGKKISTALVEAFERAQRTLKGMQSKLSSMSATSAAALRAEARRISDGVQALPLDLTTGLANLSSSELDKAASESAACRSVGARPKS